MRDRSDSVISTTSPFGLINYYDFDRPIGESLELYGQWAMSEIRFLRQFLAAGDTVIDGGANIGTHTMAFADSCGPSGRVIAVEASPEVAQLLQRNIEENGLSGVEQITAALGEAVGTCRFSRLATEGLQNVGTLCVVEEDDDQTTLQIPVVTIDSLRLESLRLLKLDVEGQELAALNGASETIERLSPIVSVELLNLDRAIPIYALLTGKGYTPHFCSFAVYESDNFRDERRDIFGVAREATLLFTPSDTSFEVTRGAIVVPINSIDDLADALREMPRYGDLTDHDRSIHALQTDRANLEKRLQAWEAKPEEIDASAWRVRLLAAEEAIKEVRHNAQFKADSVTIGVMQAELREVWKTLDRKARQDALGLVRQEVMEALPIAVKVEIAAFREDIDVQQLATDAHALRIGSEVSVIRSDLEAQRTKTEDEVAFFDKNLTELRATLVSDSAKNEKNIVRLKSELSSLREALLGRGEDRSSFVLTVEKLNDTVCGLSERVASMSPDYQLAQDQAQTSEHKINQRHSPGLDEFSNNGVRQWTKPILSWIRSLWAGTHKQVSHVD